MIKVLFFGDIVGRTGRRAVAAILPRLKKESNPNLIVANAENAAHGIGLTFKIADEILRSGVDILTTGNHIFDKPDQADEVFEKSSDKVIRPMNFEGNYKGLGWITFQTGNNKIIVANIHGQVFMEKQFDGLIGSPFAAFEEFLQKAPKSSIILVDFHAEATSEKKAFGFYVDGRVAVVIGTHTHVQTADAQVLPGGTAYISDIGMCGAANSILGVQKDKALDRFLGQPEAKLEVDEGNSAEAGYAIIEIDETNGRAKSIKAVVERIEL